MITASSGGVRASPVNLVVGTAAVGRIALAASPMSVPFDGGNSTITAVVTDAAGNPLNAMPVAFTTTTGNLTPSNAKTDTKGTVQTTLTTAASAVVTAVAGSFPDSPGGPSPASLTGSVTVPLTQPPIPAVSITASESPVARTPTTFTIGATPAPGTNTTIQNVSVDHGDGDRADLGAVSGTAIIAQHVYSNGGTYTAALEATDSAGATATASTVLAVGAMPPNCRLDPGRADGSGGWGSEGSDRDLHRDRPSHVVGHHELLCGTSTTAAIRKRQQGTRCCTCSSAPACIR